MLQDHGSRASPHHGNDTGLEFLNIDTDSVVIEEPLLENNHRRSGDGLMMLVPQQRARAGVLISQKLLIDNHEVVNVSQYGMSQP